MRIRQVIGNNSITGVNTLQVTIKTVKKCNSGYAKIIVRQNALLKGTTRRALSFGAMLVWDVN
jgi:hypothetical protein